MATAKLTLSIDPDTIEWAKKYVQKKNISLSKFIQGQLEEVAKKEKQDDPFLEKLRNENIAPEVMALSGIIKGEYPDDVKLWDVKYPYLKKKYEL